MHVNEILEALDALGACTLARLAAAVPIDKSNMFDLLVQQPPAAAQPPLLPGDQAVDSVDTTPTTDTTRTTDVAAPCPVTAGDVPPTGGTHSLLCKRASRHGTAFALQFPLCTHSLENYHNRQVR